MATGWWSVGQIAMKRVIEAACKVLWWRNDIIQGDYTYDAFFIDHSNGNQYIGFVSLTNRLTGVVGSNYWLGLINIATMELLITWDLPTNITSVSECYVHKTPTGQTIVYMACSGPSVAYGNARWIAIDITNPSTPTLLWSSLIVGGLPQIGSICIVQNRYLLFFAQTDGSIFRVIDLTTHSSIMNNFGLGINHAGSPIIAIDDNYVMVFTSAFIINGFKPQMRVINVSNPAFLSLVGSMYQFPYVASTPGSGLVVEDPRSPGTKYFYTQIDNLSAGVGYFLTFNVSNQASIQLVHTLNTTMSGLGYATVQRRVSKFNAGTEVTHVLVPYPNAREVKVINVSPDEAEHISSPVVETVTPYPEDQFVSPDPFMNTQFEETFRRPLYATGDGESFVMDSELPGDGNGSSGFIKVKCIGTQSISINPGSVFPSAPRMIGLNRNNPVVYYDSKTYVGGGPVPGNWANPHGTLVNLGTGGNIFDLHVRSLTSTNGIYLFAIKEINWLTRPNAGPNFGLPNWADLGGDHCDAPMTCIVALPAGLYTHPDAYAESQWRLGSTTNNGIDFGCDSPAYHSGFGGIYGRSLNGGTSRGDGTFFEIQTRDVDSEFAPYFADDAKQLISMSFDSVTKRIYCSMVKNNTVYKLVDGVLSYPSVEYPLDPTGPDHGDTYYSYMYPHPLCEYDSLGVAAERMFWSFGGHEGLWTPGMEWNAMSKRWMYRQIPTDADLMWLYNSF